MIYLCIYSPVCSVWFRLVYSLLPGVSCLSDLPCPALSCLDVLIKYYYLSLYPRLRVPVPPSCVHRDRRPDLTVSGAPSPRFVLFVFWKVFICSCLSVPWQGSRHSSSRLSPLQEGVGVRRDCHECRESNGRDALLPADRGRYLPPAVALPSPPAGSQVAAPPGVPFAGDHATGSPLTQCPPLAQCPPARLWLNACRIAADSMPAGLPLTQAHRIGADSCPLAAAIPGPVDIVHMSRPGVPCVCLVVPTGTF